MSQLVYSENEIMSEHAYAQLHYVAGERAHGGFDEGGSYVPPRTLVRLGAIDAWAQALCERGGRVFEVDPRVQNRPRWPSVAQQKLLIQEGLDQIFWESLTITGLLEARGRLLADAVFPDLQEIIVEDISSMGIGHLNKGMLVAHGLDEGGLPGIGAHDVMWFAIRDLALGKRDFPEPTPPEQLGRPDRPERLAPEIPAGYENMILFLMNLLMIEYSAEAIFSGTEQLLRDPELFALRRAEAIEAAEIVSRIRIDEDIHVGSLCTNLGELRSITFKTKGQGTVAGAELVDRLWAAVEHFFVTEAPAMQRKEQAPLLRSWIREQPGGEGILERFDALDEPAPDQG